MIEGRIRRALLLMVITYGAQASAFSQPIRGGVPEGAPTETVLDLSLREAVERGLQRNLGLLLALEDVGEAEGARAVARADLLPHLSGDVSVVNQKISLEAFGFSGLEGLDAVIGPFNVFDARARVSQTLLDFDAMASSRASERRLEGRRLDLETTKDTVILACVNLYLHALAAESRIEASHAQLATAEALFERAEHRKETGLSPGIDVLRAQVQAEAERQRVIVSENDAEKLKLALARAIGLPVGQRFRLSDQMPNPPSEPMSLEQAAARAYENRADLKAEQARVAAAEEETRAARGEGLPSVKVAGDFGAIGQTVASSRATYSLSAGVEVPIFEGGRVQGEVAEAEAKLRRQTAIRDDLKAGIYYEVRSHYGDVRAARQRVAVSDSALELARQQLEQAQDRFEAGVAGNIDVVQAQESLARAAEDRIESLLAYNTAKAALARALGTVQTDYTTFLRGPNR